MLKCLNWNIVDEGITITVRNKLVTERLNQTTYDFSNILGIMTRF